MTAPEISPIPREARVFQGESAGVVSRVLANTIDALIVTVFVASCYLGWVALLFMLDPRSFTWPDTRWIVTITTWLFVATAYLMLAWWLAAGRTYGDHVMGLRVIGRRGHRLGPLRSLMRAAFCVFFPIGLFWCVISPKRRSVQDVVLWTKVVYDWTPRPPAVQRHQREAAIGGEVVESVVVSDGPEAGAGSPAGLDEAPRRLRSRRRVAPPAGRAEGEAPYPAATDPGAATPADRAGQPDQATPPDPATPPDRTDQPDRHDS